MALSHEPRQTKTAYYFSTDHTLQYWNFFLDFGPLNLGQAYRFCERLNKILEDPKHEHKKIYYYSSTSGHKRANSAVLIACWAVAYLGLSVNEAYKPFGKVHPSFPPFHDASPCICTYNLTVYDCVKGFAKAQKLGFVDFKSGLFPIEEYEHYEKVEYGDLSWIRWVEILYMFAIEFEFYFISMYIYMCVCVYVQTNTYLSIHLSMYTFLYFFIYSYIYIYIYGVQYWYR